jgi:hypothetical protein
MEVQARRLDPEKRTMKLTRQSRSKVLCSLEFDQCAPGDHVRSGVGQTLSNGAPLSTRCTGDQHHPPIELASRMLSGWRGHENRSPSDGYRSAISPRTAPRARGEERATLWPTSSGMTSSACIAAAIRICAPAA